MVVSESVEDYLEAILVLQEKNGYVRSVDIAKGVFVPVSSLPQREPMKGVQSA